MRSLNALQTLALLALVIPFAPAGCGNGSDQVPATATGGIAGAGGGASAQGGHAGGNGSGGATAAIGAAGNATAGGSSATFATGGATHSAGTSGNGGSSSSTGGDYSGGTTTAGGVASTGGVANLGGVAATGGAVSASTTGGTSAVVNTNTGGASGGEAHSGGASGNGGSSSSTGGDHSGGTAAGGVATTGGTSSVSNTGGYGAGGSGDTVPPACCVFVATTGKDTNDGSSWDNAVATVQNGLDLADAKVTAGLFANCEVWVAKGTYVPTQDVTGATTPADPTAKTILLKPNVALYGGFAGTEATRSERNIETNVTALNGEMGTKGYTGDNALYVVTGADGAMIDGFTITLGQSSGMHNDMASPIVSNCTFSANGGSGMYNECSAPFVTDSTFTGTSGGSGMKNYFSYPTVNNCLFSDNVAPNGGGMSNNWSAPKITNSSFVNNTAAANGGGMSSSSSLPTLTHCVFSGNQAISHGGGMYNDYSVPTVVSTTFDSNQAGGDGGALYNGNYSAIVTSSKFAFNTAQVYGGGMYNYNCAPIVSNSTFSGNTSTLDGGGMYNETCPKGLTVVNCTFSDNQASHGGGMANDGSSPTVSNCIFWGNRAGTAISNFYDPTSAPTPFAITYSDIEGGCTKASKCTSDATGNINADPLFVDAANGDFGLQPSSPCIDAANGSVAPSLDLVGNARVDIVGVGNDGSNYADMGAYEYSTATGGASSTGTAPSTGTASSRHVTAISAGGADTCAVVDAAATCWGATNYGQVGNGLWGNLLVEAPVQVQGLTAGVTAVSSGSNHSCAVVDGGVLCWGQNYSGQLGDGTTTSTAVPVSVSGLTAGSGVTAVSADGHTCAIVKGAAMCWGDNTGGDLGNASTAASSTPVQVQGLTSGVSAISLGYSFSCAVMSGSGYCWGYNNVGQLGDGSTTNRSAPVQVQGLPGGITAVDAGYQHACALVSGGVYCWGYNGSGQLGDGSTTDSLNPVQVQGLTAGVTSIAAGDGNTCALINGQVLCWGSSVLQSGGYWVNSSVPVPVAGLKSPATAIDAGGSHTCALIEGGATCWGNNNSGQLGANLCNATFGPVSVVFP